MEEWRQALVDREGEDADSVEEDIDIEDKELEINGERAKTTEYPTQAFVTRSEVQKWSQLEWEVNIPRQWSLFDRKGEDTLIVALQVGNDAVKSEINSSVFNVVGEVIVDIICQEKWSHC